MGKRACLTQLFYPNLPFVVRWRCKKIACTKRRVGSIVCTKIGLKVGFILIIAVNEIFNWMCGCLNGEKVEVIYLVKIHAIF